MQAANVLTLLRLILSDQNNAGRWQDASLLTFIDRANKRLVRDVGFPDSRLTTPTVANVQEYQLPTIILPLRCYVAGQRVPFTDIDTLEGTQIGQYGQGLPGNTLPITGSGGAPGTLGPYAPAWVEQTPLSYPVGNTWGTPAPDAQPWFSGQRPRAYLRGGFLGLVPAPSNVTPVTIAFDCIRQPDTIVSAGQTLTTPENFLDAIAWGAASYCKFGDDSASARQEAEQTYTVRMRELRAWHKGYAQADSNGGPKPLTYRSRYSGFRKRRAS